MKNRTESELEFTLLKNKFPLILYLRTNQSSRKKNQTNKKIGVSNSLMSR